MMKSIRITCCGLLFRLVYSFVFLHLNFKFALLIIMFFSFIRKLDQIHISDPPGKKMKIPINLTQLEFFHFYFISCVCSKEFLTVVQ